MSRYGIPNTSLYIRNLPVQTREEELRGMFSKYGHVRDVYIPLDYYTRRPRDIRDAEDALYSLDRVNFHGNDLEVEFAKGDRKTPGEMRSKYNGLPRTNYRYRSPSPRRRRRHRSRSRSGSRYRSGSRHRSHRHKRHSSGSRRSKRSRHSEQYVEDAVEVVKDGSPKKEEKYRRRTPSRSDSDRSRSVNSERDRSRSRSRHNSGEEENGRPSRSSPDDSNNNTESISGEIIRCTQFTNFTVFKIRLQIGQAHFENIRDQMVAAFCENSALVRPLCTRFCSKQGFVLSCQFLAIASIKMPSTVKPP
uniref:RRM domain-containing protein n=1 Tax=Trichuris muris TaxID=70415 RepID=A0A5S6QMV5_TRIMR